MKRYKYLKKKLFDDAAIVSALADLAFKDTIVSGVDTDTDRVLDAFRRYKAEYSDLSVSEIRAELSQMDDSQLAGVVSNVKGILHELEYIEIENSDGDYITASLFANTNHPDNDIRLHNHLTNDIDEIQLKATNSESYVNSWIQDHPDGEILITKELATKMDLKSTGISNEELTVNVENFIDKTSKYDEKSDIWDYFPVIGVASSAIVVLGLLNRYNKGEISWGRFKFLVVWVTGLKVTKVGIFCTLLSIPFVSTLTGALLVVSLLLGLKETWYDSKNIIKESFSNFRTKSENN